MSQTAQPKILFDGDDFQVRHYQANSDFRLLTFDIMHAKASGRGTFGLALTKKNAIDHIAVVPKYPCWYPHRGGDIAARIIAAIKDRPTVAYGASMGGYGVLRWGRAAGADCALACSPQFTIEPDILGTRDRRYSAHFRPDLHSDMALRAEHLPDYAATIHDPHFKLDRLHVELMAGLPNLHVVTAPHMAHSTANCVTGSENATAIFRAALAHDTADIWRRVARRRKGSDVRGLYLAQKCSAKGRTGAALGVLETIRHGSPLRYFMALAQIQAMGGKTSDAIISYREALRIKPQHPVATQHLARLMAASAAKAGDGPQVAQNAGARRITEPVPEPAG